MNLPPPSIPNWQRQSTMGRQGLETPSSNHPLDESIVNHLQSEYPVETPFDSQKEEPGISFVQEYGNQDISKFVGFSSSSHGKSDMNQVILNDELLDSPFLSEFFICRHKQ